VRNSLPCWLHSSWPGPSRKPNCVASQVFAAHW